jgi:hypothetical protein
LEDNDRPEQEQERNKSALVSDLLLALLGNTLKSHLRILVKRYCLGTWKLLAVLGSAGGSPDPGIFHLKNCFWFFLPMKT